VIGVADGDTITVLHEKRPERIRLCGIDCPEKRQPFGKRAKQFTSELVFGKVVEIDPVDTDRYGRTVAFVRVEDITVNEELIKKGLGWVYVRYCKLPL
jgi:endonuclease YncB( thermonuclease family)